MTPAAVHAPRAPHDVPGLPIRVAPPSDVPIRRLVLPDGSVIPFRPIRRDDAAALQQFHERLSEASIRLRFFGVMPHLSDALARHFTCLDGEQRVALVALDPEANDELIAVVRFDREPGSDRAEYAAVVADRWQGRGLGLALTRHLIDEARARGVRTLTADVLPENARMLNLFRDLGLPKGVRDVASVAQVDVTLSGASAVHELRGEAT